MERRSFLKQATAGVAAGAVAAPALAADLPTIKWRLASGFPKTLDAIYGATETVARRVAAATGGKFQIGLFAAGEIVPTPGVLDASRMAPSRWVTQPRTGTSARTRPWPSTPPCPSV
jgi:TRAP-type mannitol/chloroaromatic compound transport system substrate-binding protein